MSNNAVAQRLVQSFVRFIYQQIDERKFEKDALESLEVAIQCLESVFNLESSEFDKELKRLHIIQEKCIRGVSKIFNETDGAPMEIGPAGAVGSSLQALSYDDSPTDPFSRIDLFGLFCSSIRIQNDIKNEAETIKLEGNRLMHVEQYYDAIAAYSKAINLNPSNPMFYCNRAAAYSRVGDFKNAAVDCRSALRIDPNYSKAYGRLGMAYSRLQREDMAMCAYANALRLDPTNVDYHNNLQLAEQRLAAVTSARSGNGAVGASNASVGVDNNNSTGFRVSSATASSSGNNNNTNTIGSNHSNGRVWNNTVTTEPPAAESNNTNTININDPRFANPLTNLAMHALQNPSVMNAFEQFNDFYEQGHVIADYIGNLNPDIFNRLLSDTARQPLSTAAVAAATAAAAAAAASARSNPQAETSRGNGASGGDAGTSSSTSTASKTKKRGLNDDDDGL